MNIFAKNLTKKYKDKVAVNDISLQLIPGKIFGLLGPNGAGKSTIIKMLSGQMRPTSGSIEIDGKEYKYIPSEIKNKIGVMPQDTIL